MRHLEMERGSGTTSAAAVNCEADPVASLVEMFVSMVQGGRIARGQCPALRPVFLKPHGVAHAVFRVRPDLPDELKVDLSQSRPSIFAFNCILGDSSAAKLLPFSIVDPDRSEKFARI